ncbi:hypothetical protein [Sediminibacillus sp. JSM 1682029]|uniref:hypothetical protein n=1 Tax=Sediminibacillus sp. JSM 1682029 TaxID=3229857 RepID=UPI00352562E0
MKVGQNIRGHAGDRSLSQPFNTNFLNNSNLKSPQKAEVSASVNVHKEEALRRMMSPILVNLSKKEDGTISFDKRSYSQEEVLAIRESDLEGMDINWASLELRLTNRNASASSTDNIANDLDYLASQYVQFSQRIKQSYPGEEQADQFQKLETIIGTQIEEYAESFSTIIGGFLENNGVSGEQTALKASVLSQFQQRKEQYQTFVEQNENFAGIRGTADEWLLADNQFMAEQLRHAYAKENVEGQDKENKGYGMEDLAAVGILAKETRNVGYNSRQLGYNKHKSEEEFGVELGLTAMKFSLLTDTYDISDSVKTKLGTAFDTFIDKQNQKAEEYIINRRNDPFTRDKESYAVGWDNSLVSEIVSSMAGSLGENDFNAAFKQVVNTAMQSYAGKTQDEQTDSLSRYHPYHNTWNTANYIGDWNRFVERLSGGNGRDDIKVSNHLSFSTVDLSI